MDTHQRTTFFEEHGYVDFGPIVPAAACDLLREKIRETRNFGPDLFMAQDEFDALNPDAFNKNPRPGCNLLDDLAADAVPIAENPELVAFLREMLGPNYETLRRKLVCGMPRDWVPDWIFERIQGRPSNNLAHFVRPEFTDLTYFFGIDYHQDLVDWKDRDPDLITVYAYIDDVTDRQSPLFLLPDTYELGADAFPHELRQTNEATGEWEYTVRTGESIRREQVMLSRPKGSVFAWHSLTLHGTQPTTALEPRVSLRYLFARDAQANTCGLDRVNERIRGPRRLSSPRFDLGVDGRPVMEKNHLYGARTGS